MVSLEAMTESPWTFDGEGVPLTTSGPLITLVEGRSFAISGTSGDISELGPQGLFCLDTRFVNRLQLLIDGDPVESLGFDQASAYGGSFVGRHVGALKLADAPTIVVRDRQIELGMTERVEIRNHGDRRSVSLVSVVVGCDFANLFAVKEGRVSHDADQVCEVDGNTMWFRPTDGRDIALQVSVDTPTNVAENGRLDWTVELDPGQTWSAELTFSPWLNGRSVRAGTGDVMASAGSRLADWHQKVPEIGSDWQSLTTCTNKALADLASLRIFDPTAPNDPVVAAGAPWFMTLFGRDSLIASWMALLVDPDLAAGVVTTLARFQGTDVNPATDEEPGKIMHEIRFAGASSAALDEGELYYGTADATPLFVMLLGELQRWGASPETVTTLLPNADRALQWVIEHGDRDGDGYVEYQRSSLTGLANQGWKDSWDGVRYADGRVADAPIVLCEIQAYTYAAYRARARLAEDFGDPETAESWETKARELRAAFNRDFWLEDRGWFAVGLDGDKQPIDSLTSNIGHCLWAGIVDEDKAAIVADHLLAPDMFTGWGVRTMSSSTPGYNPTGYHVGSVWPHDSAMVAAGLMRYALIDHAHRIMTGILDAGAMSGGRLPELMAGFDRSEFGTPMAYPASCSPQAWAAAAPLLLLRWMLRLDPWHSRKRLWVDPVLPEGVRRLSVSGIRLGTSRFSVTVEDGEVEIDGLPTDIDLQRGLRPVAPRDRWT